MQSPDRLTPWGNKHFYRLTAILFIPFVQINYVGSLDKYLPMTPKYEGSILGIDEIVNANINIHVQPKSVFYNNYIIL